MLLLHPHRASDFLLGMVGLFFNRVRKHQREEDARKERTMPDCAKSNCNKLVLANRLGQTQDELRPWRRAECQNSLRRYHKASNWTFARLNIRLNTQWIIQSQDGQSICLFFPKQQEVSVCVLRQHATKIFTTVNISKDWTTARVCNKVV